MDKYIGRLLDNRYEILEVIGTGGMAVVYKARCHRLNRLVAIKILKDDFLEDEEFRRRFHSESQAVAMLNHPNIVSVYDVSTSITADYIVMELIDGITLKQYMEKKGVLNWKETLHFAIQIAKALEHAHTHGIVHRDIKPHNVMVLKNGSVKVTDFGIARMMSKGNTLTKEALGSVHYISPEQAKGGRVDNRSDIYSLGVVMYEMMSGRPPYDGESPVAVAIQHINGGAVMPSTLNPNIPGGLEQIIMKAMAHEVTNRYATAGKMLADLDEFRKNPAILFDYNIPPTDAVTDMPKPAPEEPAPPITTAERVEMKKTDPDAYRRRSGTPARRNTHRKPEGKAGEGQNNAATIAIIACSAVIVIAIIVFLVVLFSDGAGAKSQLVDVPNLLGQVYEELPEYEGLTIIKEDEVYDETYPAGQIVKQTPEFGDKIAKNNVIKVYVSLGSAPKVLMINAEQQTLEDAERALNNLKVNLQIAKQYEYSNTIEKDKVIRTEPAPDAELTPGQVVTLYISKGVEPKVSTMPDLVNATVKDAKNVLDHQDLALQIVEEEVYDAVVATGLVARTEPAANEDLHSGQTVTLYISKGPNLQKMPNLVGMNISNAYTILTAAGFGTPNIEYVDSKETKDVVVSQSVAKNTLVDVSTEIVLEVSKGATTITKDVQIDISEFTEDGPCKIWVYRGDKIVFTAKDQAQNTQYITIPNQTGAGTVVYDVFSDVHPDSVPVEVEF